MQKTFIARPDKNGNEAWLDAPAAASIRRVDIALGFILGVVWAGRTRAEQTVLWVKYLFNPKRAARPGTSLHEKGRSIDVPIALVTLAFVRLLNAHGWYQTVAKEPWHFTYIAAKDTHINDAPAVSGGVTPKPLPAPEPEPGEPDQEEGDMRAIRNANVPDSGIIIQPGVPPYSLPDNVYDALRGAYGLKDQVLAAWQYETVQREHWAAFNAIQRFTADLSEQEIEAIATATRDKLKAVYPNAID